MTDFGKVYIVGVGPGDYKLLTIKAVECISRVDVIVYDRLVSRRILSFAKEGAEFVYVGKMPDCHPVPQEEINKILIKKALEGRTVARVKGGDPFLFGRGAEEAEALYEKGIEFEIIPGVTSAIAVPAYAGIPVTHRDYCSSLHIITGHERPDRDISLIDYEVLAKQEGTLVFLMGVKNLGDITVNLIKHGKDPNTPAAVIGKGTTSEQRTVTGTLEDLLDKVTESGIKSPAVTIIGEVVNLKKKLEWFPRGKLAGKRVIVTRAREQASKLVQKIEDLGGEVIEIPAIKIVEALDLRHFDEVLENLGSFKWLVFTSTNGVIAFFKRMRDKRIDIRNMSAIKICVVGEATAAELGKIGLIADYMPLKYTTADLLEVLLKVVSPKEKILLARADIASEELTEGLKRNSMDFDDLTVYRTERDSASVGGVLTYLEEDLIDFLTFTSSSTVKNFVSIIGSENIDKLSKIKVVCIGPVTAKTASELGIKVTAVADIYTIDGLIEKIIEILGDDYETGQKTEET